MKKRLVQYSTNNCSECLTLENMIQAQIKSSDNIEYVKLLVDDQNIDHLIALNIHKVPVLFVENDGERQPIARGIDECIALVFSLFCGF